MLVRTAHSLTGLEKISISKLKSMLKGSRLSLEEQGRCIQVYVHGAMRFSGKTWVGRQWEYDRLQSNFMLRCVIAHTPICEPCRRRAFPTQVCEFGLVCPRFSVISSRTSFVGWATCSACSLLNCVVRLGRDPFYGSVARSRACLVGL